MQERNSAEFGCSVKIMHIRTGLYRIHYYYEGWSEYENSKERTASVMAESERQRRWIVWNALGQHPSSQQNIPVKEKVN